MWYVRDVLYAVLYSGVLSSTGDVLEMSVVRGVGGVCDEYVFGSGRCGWRGG